ncbi:MAG: SMC-Scp complex subunit ScpB [Tepidisphaerales bacterium]
MGTDALSDYQRLGEQLEAAAEQVRRHRRRRKDTTGLAVPDLAGHPAEIITPSADTPGVDIATHGSVADVTDVPGGTGDGCSLPAERPQLASAEADVSSACDRDVGAASDAAVGVAGRCERDVAMADGAVVAENLAGPDAGSPLEDARASDQPATDGGVGGAGVEVAAIEALLFSTRHPLTPARLAELLGVPSVKPIRAAVAELNRQYEATGRSFRVEQVAGGYQLLTLPDYGPLLQKLHQREADSKLTRSALETLAIIAYKQPVLRAEVEAIRGVASGETIRSLMEKHLVKIAGRAEEPGRPILYGTTKRFLELFGLNSLKDLPKELPGAAGPGLAAAGDTRAEVPRKATFDGSRAEMPGGPRQPTATAATGDAHAELPMAAGETMRTGTPR